MTFLKKLFKYAFKRWHLLTLVIVFTSITTALNVYIPQLGGQVIRNILLLGDYDSLIWLVVQIVGFTGVLGVLSFALRYLNGYFSHLAVSKRILLAKCIVRD
ncbi:MAG: hypothetical protein QW279_08110 [Candidatus Jordarchaeaceae archaeon]